MKKLMLITLSSAALLSLAACATPDAAKPADGTTTAAAEQPKIFCEREGSTGSMLTKKHCGPVPTEADRARLANELQNIVRPTAAQPAGK